MKQDFYVVFHLPKTAGSALLSNFVPNFAKDEFLHISPTLRNLPMSNRQQEHIIRIVAAEIEGHTRDRVRCIFGHWAYWGIHRLVRPECKAHYITFLRDPIERCLSLYGYIKSQPSIYEQHPLIKYDWSLGEWIKCGDASSISNGQTRLLLFSDCPDILFAPLTRDYLELAKERLREYWFVGLAETFESDSLYLYGKLNFWRFNRTEFVNVTPRKPVPSPEERHSLAQANLFDSELYEFGRQLHSQWLRDNEAEIRSQQRKSQIRRAIYRACQGFRRSSKTSQPLNGSR